MVAINLFVSLNSCWGGILIHDYILNEIINNERKVNKCAKDLEIIKEKSKAISYSASEIISIKEKIFDQKLSFVDAYSSLNRLSLEVFHLHSIFPLLIGLGLDKEGVIE